MSNSVGACGTLVLQSVSQDTTRNISRMESVIDDTARAFKSMSKSVFSYLKDTNRQTVELGAKVEDNQKSSQDNKERIQGKSTELVSVKAFLELHEDKLG